MDGKTLKELCIECETSEAKKMKRLQKSAKQPRKPSQPSPHPIHKQSGKRKAVPFVTICSSDGEEGISGEEVDQWDSDLETISTTSSSSILSTITLAAPAVGPPAGSQRSQTPPSPTPGPSLTSHIPSKVHVTRSRVSGR